MEQTCPICNNKIGIGESVCASCGYRLPGSTQEFKPITSIEAEEILQGNSSRGGELRIVRGPQTGLDISLSSGKFVIGRDPQCDIFLNDMTVSRHHATIESHEEGYIIRDTNSYNGVWVNDKPITSCKLIPGDVIQIGAFCLVYREHL